MQDKGFTQEGHWREGDDVFKVSKWSSEPPDKWRLLSNGFALRDWSLWYLINWKESIWDIQSLCWVDFSGVSRARLRL